MPTRRCGHLPLVYRCRSTTGAYPTAHLAGHHHPCRLRAARPARQHSGRHRAASSKAKAALDCSHGTWTCPTRYPSRADHVFVSIRPIDGLHQRVGGSAVAGEVVAIGRPCRVRSTRRRQVASGEHRCDSADAGPSGGRYRRTKSRRFHRSRCTDLKGCIVHRRCGLPVPQPSAAATRTMCWPSGQPAELTSSGAGYFLAYAEDGFTDPR